MISVVDKNAAIFEKVQLYDVTCGKAMISIHYI